MIQNPHKKTAISGGFFISGVTQNIRQSIRLREKGGKRHEMPCPHNLEEYLVAYLNGAGLRYDTKGSVVPHHRAGHRPAHHNLPAPGECLRDDTAPHGRRRNYDQGRKP